MLSMDAYYLFGTRLSPEDAYRFARGEEITYMGEPIRRRHPLDFMAVTDHAQIIGSSLAMEDPESALATSELGRRFRNGPRRSFRGGVGIQVWRAQEAGEIPGFDIGPVSHFSETACFPFLPPGAPPTASAATANMSKGWRNSACRAPCFHEQFESRKLSSRRFSRGG